MKLQGLSHIFLFVTDIERARAFYSDVLGLEVLEQDPKHGGLFLALRTARISSIWRRWTSRCRPRRSLMDATNANPAWPNVRFISRATNRFATLISTYIIIGSR